MRKSIGICGDGSWKRPPQDVSAAAATNRLRRIEYGNGEVKIHRQVKLCWQADSQYWPDKLLNYAESRGRPARL